MTLSKQGIVLTLLAAAFLAACVSPTDPDTPRRRIYERTPYFLRAVNMSAQDQGFDVKQLSDSGFVIVGHAYSPHMGSLDVLLIRTDPDGNTLWTKTFGGIYADEGYSVVEAPDGGFLIAGTTLSFTNGHTDIWLIRTEANGALRWYRNYGGTGTDYFGKVIACSTGGFLMTGSIEDPIAGNSMTLVTRLDEVGGITWDFTLGGSQRDLGSAVIEKEDGSFLVGCTTEYRGYGKSRIRLFTLTARGDLDTTGFGWESEMMTTESKGIADFAVSRFGTYGIIGDVNPKLNVTNMLFITLDQNGEGYQEQILERNALGKAIEATPDGGFIVCGYTDPYGGEGSDIILIKLDANGTEEWRKTIGGPHLDRAFGLANTLEGGFILTGVTGSYGELTEGSTNLLLLKTDADGHYEDIL